MQQRHVNPDRPIIKWTAWHKVVLAVIVLFLAIQIGVPLAKLSSRRPARFGWHMWTTVPSRRNFSLLMRDGSFRVADLSPYVALARGELDLNNALPPHLCRMMPDVAAVHVNSVGASTAQIHKCP